MTNERSRITAAKNSRRSRELDQLARDPSARVRLAVALNPSTEEGAIHDLRFDPSAAVRAALCSHWLVLPETIGYLIQDDDPTVRAAAWAVWDERLLAIVLGAASFTGPAGASVRGLLEGAVRDSATARELLDGRRGGLS